MDRSCSEDAEYKDCKSGSILDARWEKKAGKAKGDMAKNSVKRDGRKGLDLFGDPGQGQDSVEVSIYFADFMKGHVEIPDCLRSFFTTLFCGKAKVKGDDIPDSVKRRKESLSRDVIFVQLGVG